MTSTEQGAVCATRSETLPSAWTPVSARDPITISEAPYSSAA
jgi:hypothetical protein